MLCAVQSPGGAGPGPGAGPGGTSAHADADSRVTTNDAEMKRRMGTIERGYTRLREIGHNSRGCHMSDGESKRVILARRARFVAAALASAGIVAGAVACGDTESDGSGGTGGVSTGGKGGTGGIAGSGGAAGSGGSNTGGTAGSQVCLQPPYDAGEDADADPQPCLIPPQDSGSDAPQACLKIPPDAGAD